MWSSTDAVTWTPIDMPKIFGTGGIGPISGGSAGFIALGAANNKQLLWLSNNGATWQQGALPPAVQAVGSSAGDPAAFSGGFVLPGVVLQAKGHGFTPPTFPNYGYNQSVFDHGCMSGGPTDLSMYRAALWWSPDGSNWTRIGLSGTTAANSVWMAVWALDDYTLLAQQWSSSSTGSAGAMATWASHDGKSWSLVYNVPSLAGPYLVRSKRQGLLFDWLTDAQGSTIGPQYSILNTRMSFSVVAQTGSSPWIDDWQQALGPMGILITIDGSRFWMGVPTVG